MQFSALTVIYRSWSFAQLEPLAKAANFGALLQQVETMPAAALDGGGESCAMDQALLAADLMLALGREEEAEERFRLAVRIASGLGKTAVRFASGRVSERTGVRFQSRAAPAQEGAGPADYIPMNAGLSC